MLPKAGLLRDLPCDRTARRPVPPGRFSVGCYCEDEARCHRSVLRELLIEAGAALSGPTGLTPVALGARSGGSALPFDRNLRRD